MVDTNQRRCIDCTKEGLKNRRKASGKPLLCASHRRARRSSRRSYSWERHIKDTYGITPDDYWEVYRFQGGHCAICQRATGVRKKLSVDHCHATGRVRGLLCGTCNRSVLGHLRDDIQAFQRAIDYLNNPPAAQAIGCVYVPEEDK